MKVLSMKTEERFNSKKACLAEADRILKEGLLDGMSRKQIAREIYFHRRAYVFCEKTGMFRWIKEQADPIDMKDGGDTLFRRIVFFLTWKLM